VEVLESGKFEAARGKPVFKASTMGGERRKPGLTAGLLERNAKRCRSL